MMKEMNEITRSSADWFDVNVNGSIWRVIIGQFHRYSADYAAMIPFELCHHDNGLTFLSQWISSGIISLSYARPAPAPVERIQLLKSLITVNSVNIWSSHQRESGKSKKNPEQLLYFFLLLVVFLRFIVIFVWLCCEYCLFGWLTATTSAVFQPEKAGGWLAHCGGRLERINDHLWLS